MASIRLRLLGSFDLQIDDRTSEISSQKVCALAAYLAMSAGQHLRRERLAGLLWAESEEARARDSLKHALASLRKSLGSASGALETTREAVVFHKSDIWVDAVEFEDCANREALAPLDRAIALYRGGLLQSLTLDTPGFDDWLLAERQRLAMLADYAAGRLMAHFVDHGPSRDAIGVAQRVLAMDPHNERACRLLMRSQAESGHSAAALKTYRDFALRLKSSLDLLPEETTAQLFREIQTNRQRKDGASTLQSLPEAQAGAEARPTIAVLPFKTLADESDRKYFADGVAEEITTALSRNRSMIVISRNSSFITSERQLETHETGRALGARYLVEGSIKRSGDRVRLNISLIDAPTGAVIWSDVFQNAATDIFDLQDQIAAQVSGTLLPKVEQAEIARSTRKPTSDLGAYDYYLRGLSAMHTWTKEGNARAIELFRKAIERDPTFAAAHAMTIRCYSQRKASGWARDRVAETAEVVRLSRTAVDLAPDDALVLTMAGIGLGFVAGEPEQGVRFTERAIALNPNLAMAWLFSGWIHVWLGLPETAIEHLERAMRLSPQDPQFTMMQTATACAHFFAGRSGIAVKWAEDSVLARPNYWIAWCILAAARSATGNDAGASEAMHQVLGIDPDLSVATLKDSFPIRGETNATHWTEALAKAGLPG
jgi:TolB-like protein